MHRRDNTRGHKETFKLFELTHVSHGSFTARRNFSAPAEITSNKQHETGSWPQNNRFTCVCGNFLQESKEKADSREGEGVCLTLEQKPLYPTSTSSLCVSGSVFKELPGWMRICLNRFKFFVALHRNTSGVDSKEYKCQRMTNLLMFFFFVNAILFKPILLMSQRQDR